MSTVVSRIEREARRHGVEVLDPERLLLRCPSCGPDLEPQLAGRNLRAYEEVIKAR